MKKDSKKEKYSWVPKGQKTIPNLHKLIFKRKRDVCVRIKKTNITLLSSLYFSFTKPKKKILLFI